MKRTALSALLLLVGVANAENPFDVEPIAQFDEPWSMAFLPNGDMLVGEKKGRIWVVTQEGVRRGTVRGVPDVDYGGQGGFGDIVLHPKFAANQLLYISYVEGGVGNTRGAAVARGKLAMRGRGATLSQVEVVWRQYPKTVGFGHYGHRIAFDSDGYMFITSGDRQKFTPSQDMQSNIGKIVRLKDDGSVPQDNPFVDHYAENPLVDDEGVYPEIWSLGHRNPLGIAFDGKGQLWDIEMGPAGGDELNLVVKGGNYGYPSVSNGEHYDGRPIPDHDTDTSFIEPASWWTPTISPGHLMTVRGDQFSAWRGDLLAAGLSSQAIVRIEVDEKKATEVERYDMGARIRSIVEGPAGALWVLEDERRPSQGRLLKLTPK